MQGLTVAKTGALPLEPHSQAFVCPRSCALALQGDHHDRDQWSLTSKPFRRKMACHCGDLAHTRAFPCIVSEVSFGYGPDHDSRGSLLLCI
jgi:hypothetical protein